MAIWKERFDTLKNTLKNSSADDFKKDDLPKTEHAIIEYPKLIGKLLASRGFTIENSETILNPTLNNLKNPSLMLGMDKAVHRICEAFKKNQKVCIYADFDLDGSSGLGLLKQGLEFLGFKDISYYQPKRLSDGYGFHAHAVEELKISGIELIITVDVGITSHAAFSKARELGIDVILTDHHLPTEILPDAYTIINPNQKDDSSGLGYLCGAGVAFYLCRALKRAFFEDADLPKHQWDLKELLDLFCIATLTDMVPLIEDNRVLVKHGMICLAHTKKPGLLALLEALDLTGRPLTSQDIAIKFAPKLNALSRMESDILPIDIYLEKNLNHARSIVDQILKNNSTRQHLQSHGEEKAFALLKDWPHEDFVFVESVDFHRGIIGLIATKLASEFNRPAFVGSQNSEGMIVGSCRLPSGHDSSLVQSLGHAGQFLNRFGGHAQAAGFELHAKNKDQVILKLHEYYQTLKSNPAEALVEFDLEAKLTDLDSTFMKWYDHIGPFGVGFTTPLLRFNNLALAKFTELKGGHLKLQFEQESQKSDALLFSPNEKHKNLILNPDNKNFDILGEVQWNYFRNRQSLQILVKDLKVN